MMSKGLRVSEPSPSWTVGAHEVRIAETTGRNRPVYLTPCPEVASRESTKHRRSTRLRTLTLKGIEDFLDGVHDQVTLSCRVAEY